MATEHDDLDPRLAGAIAALRDPGPATDLWPGIAARLTPRRRGSLRISWPVAAAAAIALVAGSSIVTRQLLIDRSQMAPVATLAVTDDGRSLVLPAGFDSAATTLAGAINRVEVAYAAVAPTLDAETSAAISQSLATLDTAITDAARQVGAAPNDLEAARHLTWTMKRKLRVLQTVASLGTMS
jgi:hypothetical protein